MRFDVYSPPLKTMMELYENLPEGTLAPLINNQIYMSVTIFLRNAE